ncbi:MAG: streptomycin biosynthesis enzyme StrG [Bacteroidota bacterium]
MKNAKFLPYDTDQYPFAKILAEQIYKVPDLSKLHLYYQKMKRRKGKSGAIDYSDNLILRALMQRMKEDSPFYQLYRSFVFEQLAPFFGGKISFTAHPKFRVHLAGTDSVSKWHIDVDYTHRHEQINAWMPFTNCFDTNTIWVENDYGSEDYLPVDVMYGEVLLFDGGYLSHGTVPNKTDMTRVSLDFRFHSYRNDPPFPDRGILSGRPAQYYDNHLLKKSKNTQ